MSSEFEWFIAVQTLIGTLISRLRDGSYLIYFPYTRGGIRHIREGRLVAVRNFHSESTRDCYSILELVEVQPVHHALGVSPESIKSQFPGFVTEAARSCRMDWEQEEPTEETTVIHAVARPTEIQLSARDHDFSIQRDESMPMPGESAILLSPSGMERIMNWRVEGASIISPCWLATESEVNLKLDVRELLETHVGVFGFTGTGKSNLVSTLTSQMLRLDWNLRVVIMDYMFEYFPLLADCFMQLDQALLLLDFLQIPGGEVTFNALSYDSSHQSLREAALLLIRSMTKPREFRRESVIHALENVMFQCLQQGKVRVLLREPTGERISSQLGQIMDRYGGARWLGKARHAIETWVRRIALRESLDAKMLGELSRELREYAARREFPIPAPRARSAAAETIARRGRKLGLGLCIATQRAGYLDTRMMGQLHTYFISKLPREYDRKVIAEAYGINREVVDQALHFPVGQWLVISHTATGMPGVPIPARFQNAEDRVLRELGLRLPEIQ